MLRKYATKFKTTTAEGMREYNKLLKRDKRKQERIAKIAFHNLGLFQMENW